MTNGFRAIKEYQDGICKSIEIKEYNKDSLKDIDVSMHKVTKIEQKTQYIGEKPNGFEVTTIIAYTSTGERLTLSCFKEE